MSAAGTRAAAALTAHESHLCRLESCTHGTRPEAAGPRTFAAPNADSERAHKRQARWVPTNLMATAWLFSRLTPNVCALCERAGHTCHRRQQAGACASDGAGARDTIVDDSKAAFANLFAYSKVDSDNI